MNSASGRVNRTDGLELFEVRVGMRPTIDGDLFGLMRQFPALVRIDSVESFSSSRRARDSDQEKDRHQHIC